MADKWEKFGIGLVIMLIVAIVGFQLYRAYTGESTINQVIVFGLLGLSALGLVRFFISSGEKTITAEDFISTLVLVAVPLLILFYSSKIGLNLFSVAPLFGASGAFNVEFGLQGSVIDWIKANLFVTTIIIAAVYWFYLRKKLGR